MDDGWTIAHELALYYFFKCYYSQKTPHDCVWRWPWTDVCKASLCLLPQAHKLGSTNNHAAKDTPKRKDTTNHIPGLLVRASICLWRMPLQPAARGAAPIREFYSSFRHSNTGYIPHTCQEVQQCWRLVCMLGGVVPENRYSRESSNSESYKVEKNWDNFLKTGHLERNGK